MPSINTDIIHHYLRTRESSLEETGMALKSLTEKYPWFEGGQVLYALWEKQSGSSDAENQLSKAKLHLGNPLMLNWQVHKLNNMAIPEPKLDIIVNDTDDNVQTVTELTTSHKSDTETFETEKTIEQIKEEKNDEVLAFEPMHTVDYFASQGIRLQQEQLGNDSFSKQVKTFTQWLQSMKKVYHNGQAVTAKPEDTRIAHLADASNEAGEILTETMADVLIQQGKNTQAIRILEKLSLLHPEKSSYFVTRISELKTR